MLRRQLILGASILIVASMVGFGFMSRNPSNPVGIPPYPSWLTNSDNEVSISQLAVAYSAHNLTLEVPSWLPSGYSLTSIHVPDPANPYSLAMLTYSANGITDFRYAEIVFQIIPGAQPSANDLSAAVSNSHGAFQLLTIEGKPVLLNPEAPTGDPVLQREFGSSPYAMFWNGGVYYQIRVYHPLTTVDVLKMLTSLQPVK